MTNQMNSRRCSYVQAIQHANWDRVDVVTNGKEKGGLSPVIPALKAKLSAGELSTTINFHTVRSSTPADELSTDSPKGAQNETFSVLTPKREPQICHVCFVA